MSDNKNCLAFYQPGYCVLNFSFIIYIKGSCSFIQKNDRSVFQKSACDRKALAFTT